jgi:hypothetical protein
VNPSIALTVQVTDSLAPTRSASATVTITVSDVNEAPVLAAGQSFSVNEQSLAGTVVGVALASDQDAGSILTWSIVGGNVGGAFTIDPATGQIRVANPAALDFETYPLFTLTLRVEDAGGLADTANVNVALLDVIEPVVSPPPPVPGGSGGGPIFVGSEPETGLDPEEPPAEEEKDEAAVVLGEASTASRAPISAAPPFVLTDGAGGLLQRFFGTRDDADRSGSAEAVPAKQDDGGGDALVIDEAMWEALDLLDLDLSEGSESQRSALITGTIEGATAIMVAGFLTWFLRGGALLTSLLSTLPLWSRVDPLFVLAARDDEDERNRAVARRKPDVPGADENGSESADDDAEGEQERRAAEILDASLEGEQDEAGFN